MEVDRIESMPVRDRVVLISVDSELTAVDGEALRTVAGQFAEYGAVMTVVLPKGLSLNTLSNDEMVRHGWVSVSQVREVVRQARERGGMDEQTAHDFDAICSP